ncbi:hypothetical protein CASFOL_008976 [Castilleja foliolosa]|uniref:Uncharacterized protein n=1 Tax=Castilleja foliolosa TaxID=1961234 RepID=A0ABD3E0I6_9LAMI
MKVESCTPLSFIGSASALDKCGPKAAAYAAHAQGR